MLVNASLLFTRPLFNQQQKIQAGIKGKELDNIWYGISAKNGNSNVSLESSLKRPWEYNITAGLQSPDGRFKASTTIPLNNFLESSVKLTLDLGDGFSVALSSSARDLTNLTVNLDIPLGRDFTVPISFKPNNVVSFGEIFSSFRSKKLVVGTERSDNNPPLRGWLLNDTTILALGGNDTLIGQWGNDTLVGHAGADQLTGGWGRDKFQYRSPSDSVPFYGADSIQDFKRGDDIIDLRLIDADRFWFGDQSFRFIGKEKFSGAGGEVRYQTIGNNSIVQVNIHGYDWLAPWAADMAINVMNVTDLSASDFYL